MLENWLKHALKDVADKHCVACFNYDSFYYTHVYLAFQPMLDI